MSKIFASPGIAARPLTPLERLREWKRYGLPALWRHAKWKLYHWRNRHRLEELNRALSSAFTTPLVDGKPLQIESLEATLSVVTFDESHLKLSR